MSNLEDHTELELRKAGLYEKDSDYSGLLAEAVMELVKTFSGQEHSGFSAARTVALFKKVAMFEPLCALTGDDDEWTEVHKGCFQNKRCSHVFMEDGKAYDIEGRVFLDLNGIGYTCFDSRTPVTFPYSPKTKYVKPPLWRRFLHRMFGKGEPE